MPLWLSSNQMIHEGPEKRSYYFSQLNALCGLHYGYIIWKYDIMLILALEFTCFIFRYVNVNLSSCIIYSVQWKVLFVNTCMYPTNLVRTLTINIQINFCSGLRLCINSPVKVTRSGEIDGRTVERCNWKQCFILKLIEISKQWSP